MTLAGAILGLSLMFNSGVGYDIKDGGSFLSGGKYEGLDDNWRWHGNIGLFVEQDINKYFKIQSGWDHWSSLYDGLSGSPRDADYLYIKTTIKLFDF